MAGANPCGGPVSRIQRGWIGVAWLALCLWVFSLALSASASLHHWLHEDSGSPQHHCLATWLPEGKAQAASATASVPQPLGGVEIHLRPAFRAFVFPLPSLPVGRGPPSL